MTGRFLGVAIDVHGHDADLETPRNDVHLVAEQHAARDFEITIADDGVFAEHVRQLLTAGPTVSALGAICLEPLDDGGT